MARPPKKKTEKRHAVSTTISWEAYQKYQEAPEGKKGKFLEGCILSEDSNGSRELLDILREMFSKGVIKVYPKKMTQRYKDTLEEL